MNVDNEKEWIEFIEGAKTDTVIEKVEAKVLLKDKIVSAIKKNTEGAGKFGILFSGGVDSSLIALVCKQLGREFTCYSVGIEKAEDLEYAQRVAEKLDFVLKTKVLSLEDVEDAVKEVIRITGRRDIVTMGVGAVVLAAAKLALKDKVKVVFSGLGSEEIFAGYQRHMQATNINEECWNGLIKMWQRDIMRDLPISKALGVELKVPFLDKEVIETAMQVSGEHKLNEYGNKLILREIAEEMGLGDFAWRKKKAAQYGSNFDKAIEKLAKKNGFKYKKDYLLSLQIPSR